MADEPPAAPENLPVPQAVQTELPEFRLYDPAGHELQIDSPELAASVPAVHMLHTEAPALLNDPAAHA